MYIEPKTKAKTLDEEADVLPHALHHLPPLIQVRYYVESRAYCKPSFLSTYELQIYCIHVYSHTHLSTYLYIHLFVIQLDEKEYAICTILGVNF